MNITVCEGFFGSDKQSLVSSSLPISFNHPESESVSASVITLCNPRDWSPPGSSVHGDSPGKNKGVGYFLHQGNLPGIELRSPAFQVDFLPYELPGKRH